MQQTSKRISIVKQQIKECFDAWTESWNRGDLNGYIDGYFDSDITRYVSGKKVVIGKQNIHDLLESRGSPRGDLSIVSFEAEVMGDCNDALCFGQYKLKLPPSEVNQNNDHIGDENTTSATTHAGYFTVHVRNININGKENDHAPNWKIISDHSS